MFSVLAVSGLTVGVLVAASVFVTVILWHVSRPPVLTSSTLAPVLRRGVYWWLGITVLFSLAALAWILLRTQLGFPRDGAYRFVPLMLGLVPLLVINPLYIWRTAWVRKALAQSRGRLCTHCAYDVSGLAAAGNCPECGKAYNTEADKAMWGTMYSEKAAVVQGPRLNDDPPEDKP